MACASRIFTSTRSVARRKGCVWDWDKERTTQNLALRHVGPILR